MKRLFKVGKEYFEKKSDAKVYRNKLEGYTPVKDKETGLTAKHNWKFEIKRGPDHWRGVSK